MRLDEAKKICRVVERADGGCLDCVSGLVELLNEQFKGELVFSVTDTWDALVDVEALASGVESEPLRTLHALRANMSADEGCCTGYVDAAIAEQQRA